MKINKHDAGHMMAAMPIYANLFRNQWADFDDLCMKHQRLKIIIFCSNDNPGLTLTYFTVWSNFAASVFRWENVTVMDSLKIIASCDLEYGL